MGKSLGDDLREGKATLPLIAAMQRGNAEQSELVRTAIEQGDVNQLNAVLEVVKATGAIEVARIAAQKEAQRAIDALRPMPSGPHTECLVQLASELLWRNRTDYISSDKLKNARCWKLTRLDS